MVIIAIQPEIVVYACERFLAISTNRVQQFELSPKNWTVLLGICRV